MISLATFKNLSIEACVSRVGEKTRIQGRSIGFGHFSERACVTSSLTTASRPLFRLDVRAKSFVDDAVEAPHLQSLDKALQWASCQGIPSPPKVEASMVEDPLFESMKVGVVAKCEASPGDPLIQMPGSLCLTAADTRQDPILASLAEGRSELVALALFVMKERSRVGESKWTPILESLPSKVDTPVLWADEERERLLRGSPALKEARLREQALLAEWKSLQTQIDELKDSDGYPPSIFNQLSFLNAMTVVLAYAVYLPSAECFALLAVVGNISRTGSAAGALIDYDVEAEAVVVTATEPYKVGQEVRVFDGRSNGELLLATGWVELSNPADYLMLQASLVAADRMYQLKKDILEQFGFGTEENFPIYADRIATQHLAYLRLSRLTDAAQLARVSFDEDVIVSPENEYEVLQLMMADLRDLTQGYDGNYEDDLKELQRRDLDRRSRLATALRLAEKRIIQGTMAGIRKRLAPVRGIPTKSGGLEDPNADLLEVFETIESLPQAPIKLFQGLASWARGDLDPDWRKGERKQR